MNVETRVEVFMESILFCLAIAMVVVVEVVSRRREQARSLKLTAFLLRESVQSTDSCMSSTDILEFIRQTQPGSPITKIN
jgi:hypothetical protein